MFSDGTPHYTLRPPHVRGGAPIQYWTEGGIPGYPDAIRLPRPIEPPCSIAPPCPITLRPNFSSPSSSQSPVSSPWTEVSTLNLPPLRHLPTLRLPSDQGERLSGSMVRGRSRSNSLAQIILEPGQLSASPPDRLDYDAGSQYVQNHGSNWRPRKRRDDSHAVDKSSTFTQSHIIAPNMTRGIDGYKTCVGRFDVPGEGPYYLYDDGSRCPMHVNGEYVHPEWGLTKAHKPRKRLRKACLNCRERKIQCKPRKDGCLGCQKSKQPCLTQVTPEPF